MAKMLIEIAAEMVRTQVSLRSMPAAEIAASLRQVFSTLNELQKTETGGIDIEVTQPAAEEVSATKLSPANSIQDDKVICLECGKEMRQLTTKHLVSHGMTQKEYRQKYGFSMQTPLAAKSVSEAQSKAAKRRGLPEKLTQLNKARRKQKTQGAAQSTEANPANKPKWTRLRKKNAD
jgi:predicted transcriptional regulator